MIGAEKYHRFSTFHRDAKGVRSLHMFGGCARRKSPPSCNGGSKRVNGGKGDYLADGERDAAEEIL